MLDKQAGVSGFILGDLYRWELGPDGYYVITENTSKNNSGPVFKQEFETMNPYDLMEDIGD